MKKNWKSIARIAQAYQIAPIRVWVLIRKGIVPHIVKAGIGTMVDGDAFDKFAKNHAETITAWAEAYAHRKLVWVN